MKMTKKLLEYLLSYYGSVNLLALFYYTNTDFISLLKLNRYYKTTMAIAVSDSTAPLDKRV